ncbi:hypothetical protein AVEN_239636-1 [Araneus ventricosus]|uniref:Uncharacterized protein n=1 Tax=Araneus ventricosus TaxID=182803 RepID=A0A4Y2MIH6_ARAVE|nr:hypothetical protein AVEN_239636-1 [Araneus ventricosus]
MEKAPRVCKEASKSALIFQGIGPFEDESNFNIHRSNGRVMVWIKPNQQMLTKNLRGTLKALWHRRHGVGVYECCWCLQFLCFIEEIYVYHNIIKQNVLNSAEKLSFGTTFTFHQDKTS